PEAIILYSTPILRNLARAVMRRVEGLDRRLFFWQVGRFIRDDAVRRELLPQFYERFLAARPAFWRLNVDLLGTVLSRTWRGARLRAFPRPVRIVFGTDDPYLNVRVARRFARLFPAAALDLVKGARHYVQIDEPQTVAAAILSSHGARSVS
ncbi:MAG TPA: alpha/beta fold hydrolase, partial [Kribbellaceae bacterium]